jgi:hypothetical protein
MEADGGLGTGGSADGGAMGDAGVGEEGEGGEAKADRIPSFSASINSPYPVGSIVLIPPPYPVTASKEST